MRSSTGRGLVTAAFVAWVFVLSLVASSEIRCADPSGNGDVNGSGRLDLSDAVYVLNFLFLGGPPPISIFCPAPGSCEGEEPPSSFESQYYKGLDLDQAAKEQYGFLATVESIGDHLNDWRARVGRDLKSLDVARAVMNQYGPEWSTVATGVHRFDWKAFRLAEPDHVVLPVMLIASDRFLDIAGVAKAITRFRSTLGRVQSWYNGRVEGTLRFLQPLALPTSLTSTQWNDLSAMTAQEATRYVLLDQCIADYGSHLPPPGENLRVVLSIYTGDSADVWLGAASTGRYAMAPPRATSLDCPAAGPLDEFCSDAVYAIGHELGHTFGLGHTCDDFPGNPHCTESIMQTGHPPCAILLQKEISVLLDSPFFHPLEGGGGGAPAAPPVETLRADRK